VGDTTDIGASVIARLKKKHKRKDYNYRSR